MPDFSKKTKTPPNSFTLSELEKMHPHKMMLLLGMLGSGLIFLFLLVAYSAAKPVINENFSFEFPRAFVISTLLLLVSSFTVSRVVDYFEREKSRQLKRSLLLTLTLGFLFSVSQFFGWNELTNQNVYNYSREAAVYLYVLSGMHILHTVLGLIYLAYCYILTLKRTSDAVLHLVFFTNPFRKLQLELLRIYWHFIDGLWLLLFFYFLFAL